MAIFPSPHMKVLFCEAYMCIHNVSL